MDNAEKLIKLTKALILLFKVQRYYYESTDAYGELDICIEKISDFIEKYYSDEVI